MEMAKILQVFVCVFMVAVAVEVSAENHHVVGGDGGWSPALDINSWLSGRVFRVGDKILFTYDPATAESIVELQSLEDFESCNLANPIKMYTDGTSHVELDKEGTRYFTSGNLESCKKGLKLPVPVQAHSEFDPPSPFLLPPPFGPFDPPFRPTPHFGPPPPEAPSASTHLNGLSYVLFVGLALCYMGV
ncbi:hypothetical protein ACJIZ3_006693 [Penstemon smallii]|uniref:Phytocyanin domain-containing protein n=1 Tax=Penstemon smallii TaxID=265156 RepID=A0ABD3S8M2_9LAMI